MNIPTFLTFIRIGLIPIFVLAYYVPVAWANVATTAIFVLAGITDWFDGYLARRLNQTSAFGAFLDPVADKLMVAVALIMLMQSHPNAWMGVPAAIIIGREITVSAMREWMAELGKRAHVAVSVLGKYKTALQIAALILLLYHEPLLGLPIQMLGFVLLYVAAGLTVWSMFVYLETAWTVLRARSPQDTG